jgi:hypothetical protein
VDAAQHDERCINKNPATRVPGDIAAKHVICQAIYYIRVGFGLCQPTTLLSCTLDLEASLSVLLFGHSTDRRQAAAPCRAWPATIAAADGDPRVRPTTKSM